MNKLSKKTYLLYGLGVSYFILDRIFVQWLNFFYLPPENSGLMPLLTTKYLTLGFIIIRLVDAIADPLVGYLSDHSNSKFGRRSKFMILGGIPLSISMILFFYPITTSQFATFIYFVLIGSMFFVSYTLVGGPYNALVADLSETKNDRINLSTVQSVFRLIFSALPMILSAKMIAYFSANSGQYSASGFRKTVMIFSLISALGVYICSLFLNENKIAKKNKFIEKVSFRKTIKKIMHKEVIYYFLGLFFFFTGFNIIQMAMQYYVTTVLNKGLGLVSLLSTLLFIAAAIFFPITNILAKKFGFKKIMILNILSMILGVLAMIVFRNYSIIYIYIAIFIIGAGTSGAGFIFPPAMLSEIATEISKEDKVSAEGILFGIQGFFLKLAFMTKAIISINAIVYKSNVSANGLKSATSSGTILTLICAIILFGISIVFYSLKKD